jgi:hypothetical protein
MINFLVSLIPVCLGIWAVHILFQEGHLLEKPGKWITNRIGEYWSKPLFACPICQSSCWGLMGFFAIRYFFNVDLPLKQLLPFIFNLAGLNTLLSKLVNKERIIVDE